MIVRVPKLENVEKARTTRQFRGIARDLLDNPNNATWCGERPRNWKQAGKRIKCEDGRKAAWGIVGIKGHGRLVWVESENRSLIGVTVQEPEKVFGWLRQMVIGIMVLTIAMTAFGIWSFIRFEKERGDFLAATAHDLTTPIVGLKMAIGNDNHEAKMLADRLFRVVENLRDFINLHGRKTGVKREIFDLRAACNEAYSLFREDYREIYAGEDVHIRGDDELMVVGDETRTVQIMWNLFGNELKYAAPHGKVDVVLATKNAYAMVEFRDEGPGMTAYARRRAFDRYYRTRSAMISGKGGFGIGLCAARDFARAMGGDLFVEKNEPRGCVFTLMLPLADEKAQLKA